MTRTTAPTRIIGWGEYSISKELGNEAPGWEDWLTHETARLSGCHLVTRLLWPSGIFGVKCYG